MHSLDAHPSNWSSAVQAHAVSLLRNGEVSTFPALIRRVLEDVRHDTAAASSNSSISSSHPNPSSSANGAGADSNNAADKNGTGAETNGVNGTKKAGVNGVADAGAAPTESGNLAIPPAVLEAVLKLARESIESVCSLEGGGAATNGN